MDRAVVLNFLGLAAQNWGSAVNGTYAEFAAAWRGTVSVPTEAQLDAAWTMIQNSGGVDAIQAQTDRDTAKAFAQRLDAMGRIVRALAVIAMNSDNVLRKRDRDFNAAVAAAPTLAALKTSVAAFPVLDDLVKNNVITALLAQLDNNA